MRSGIYSITNATNGVFYIGSAVDIKRRWSTHKSELHKGTHRSKKLQNAWNKYGESAFVFAVIEMVSDVTRLIEREQAWIDGAVASKATIYNINLVAGSALGMVHSKDAKDKISKAGRRPCLEQTRAKISAALNGKKKSKEHVMKLKARRFDNETKAKIGAKSKGRKWSEERIKNHIESKKGVPRSAETVRRMSAALMGHDVSDETRAKISAARKGVPWSDARRAAQKGKCP